MEMLDAPLIHTSISSKYLWTLVRLILPGVLHLYSGVLEKQLMKKFSQAQRLFSMEFPFNSDILPHQYSGRKESH